MAGIDRRQRHLKDFLKVGRIGRKWKLFGAPEGTEETYDTAEAANAALNNVLANFEKYEVVNRRVVRKEDKGEE